MSNVIANPKRQTNLLVSTTILTLGLMANVPALSATAMTSTAPPRLKADLISQNLADNQVSLEKIYISEAGTNLGWLIRVNNSLIAVDASGVLIKILERTADNSGNNTVEYYASGMNEGKIMRIGNHWFQYYNNAGIEQGKIRSIGNFYFQYYNSGSIENGRILSVGDIYFRFFNSGLNGIKLQSIGNVSFTYNNNGKMQSISGSQPGVSIQTLSMEQWRLLMGVQEPLPDYLVPGSQPIILHNY
ncbi:MAG: hypothetical protein AB1589_29430 [Cyanobacteriota bacterium]